MNINIYEYQNTSNETRLWFAVSDTPREWSIDDLDIPQEYINILINSTLEDVHVILAIELSFKKEKPFKRANGRVSY